MRKQGKSRLRSTILAGAAAAGLGVASAPGATLFWDTDTVTAGAQGNTVAGTWNTTGANTVWWNGTTNVAWPNGANTATFGGTAGTVTVGTVSVGTGTGVGMVDFAVDGYTLTG